MKKWLSDRVRSVIGTFIAALRRVGDLFRDPPLDVLIAGLLGLSVGRIVVAAALVGILVPYGLWHAVVLVVTGALIEVIIQSLSARELLRLMRYEVTNEARYLHRLVSAPATRVADLLGNDLAPAS